jgi:hypothetical protein
VPAAVLADLKGRCRANAERDLLLVEELPRLVAGFESRGIRAIPFKGPLIAASLYGNLEHLAALYYGWGKPDRAAEGMPKPVAWQIRRKSGCHLRLDGLADGWRLGSEERPR